MAKGRYRDKGARVSNLGLGIKALQNSAEYNEWLALNLYLVIFTAEHMFFSVT